MRVIIANSPSCRRSHTIGTTVVTSFKSRAHDIKRETYCPHKCDNGLINVVDGDGYDTPYPCKNCNKIKI